MTAPVFNRFAATTLRLAAIKSPAGAAGGMHGSRGPTGARRHPREQAAAVPADGGKGARSATRQGGTRFLAFAQACQKAARETAARQAADSHIPSMGNFDDIPAGHGMRQAAMRRALAHGSKTQAEIDTEDRQARETARFIMNAAAKARGQKPTAPPTPAATVKHDISTPEGVAAFVAASATKARGGRR